MTPDNLAALRTFFASIGTRLPNVAALTYRRLFEAEPEATKLFKGNTREQQLLFMEKLQSIIKLTRSSQLWPVYAPTGQVPIPKVAELGRRHAQAGVTVRHFVVVKGVLAGVCREVAPAEFTPPVAEALAFIFDVLAQSLSSSNDSTAGALARLRWAGPGTALADPAIYFDEELSA